MAINYKRKGKANKNKQKKKAKRESKKVMKTKQTINKPNDQKTPQETTSIYIPKIYAYICTKKCKQNQ